NELAEERLPALYRVYAKLEAAHRELWERDNRRFGWEVLCLRYGGVMQRLLDVQDEVRRYLRGELATIEELEAEPMPFRRNDHLFSKLTMPAKVY
ncbi:MAG: hypothetical protein IJ649_06085, partial [Oscillospiraceae bacterium]|nr:hypothetical protein [Oscillospiraceae bacterium]